MRDETRRAGSEITPLTFLPDPTAYYSTRCALRALIQPCKKRTTIHKTRNIQTNDTDQKPLMGFITDTLHMGVRLETTKLSHFNATYFN